MRLLGVVPLLLGAVTANASSVNLGILPFDPLGGGINVFTISNLTGDPGLGGQALPTDFPVFTYLTFLNSDLTVVIGGNSQTFSLGDIGPGSFSSPDLQFPDTTQFDSATFSATLSATTLLLSDTTVWTADSAQLTVALLPSAGTFLSPGDLAVITADQTTAVPEPASAVLIALTAAALVAFRRPRRQGKRSRTPEPAPQFRQGVTLAVTGRSPRPASVVSAK